MSLGARIEVVATSVGVTADLLFSIKGMVAGNGHQASGVPDDQIAASGCFT